MKMKDSILFTNGRIITPDKILDETDLLISEGRIVEAGKDLPRTGKTVLDLKGNYIAPGMTELHIHGCSLWGFEDIDSVGFRDAADFLLSRGITRAVPTLQWERKSVENLAEIIENYITNGGLIEIPGIYIEGPFINPDKRGGISEEAIALPSPLLAREMVEAGRGLIRIVTLAPELPGAEEIADIFIKANIIPSFGHSNANLNQAEDLFDRCIKHGLRPGMTHMFNASSPLSHRDPGLAMLPFTREVFYELNGDGIHVDGSMLKLMKRTGLEDRMILISDALISAGEEEVSAGQRPQKEIEYKYYGRKVIPTGRGVRLADGDILAGSSMLVPDIVKNYIRSTGASLNRTIHSVSGVPASFLGIGGGVIREGSRTGLVILDEDLTPVDTFLAGTSSPESGRFFTAR